MGERIVEFLRASPGKLVVFVDAKATLAKLHAAFPPSAVLTAVTPFAERESELQRFRTDADCRLLLAHIAVAGTGIDLSVANQVFFDCRYPHEVPVWLQAHARVKRPNAEMFPA